MMLAQDYNGRKFEIKTRDNIKLDCMFFTAHLTEEVITKNEFNKKENRKNSKDILLNRKPE